LTASIGASAGTGKQIAASAHVDEPRNAADTFARHSAWSCVMQLKNSAPPWPAVFPGFAGVRRGSPQAPGHRPEEKIRWPTPPPVPFAGSQSGPSRARGLHRRTPDVPLHCSPWKRNMASQPPSNSEINPPSRPQGRIPGIQLEYYRRTTGASYRCSPEPADDLRPRR